MVDLAAAGGSAVRRLRGRTPGPRLRRHGQWTVSGLPPSTVCDLALRRTAGQQAVRPVGRPVDQLVRHLDVDAGGQFCFRHDPAERDRSARSRQACRPDNACLLGHADRLLAMPRRQVGQARTRSRRRSALRHPGRLPCLGRLLLRRVGFPRRHRRPATSLPVQVPRFGPGGDGGAGDPVPARTTSSDRGVCGSSWRGG